MGNKSPREIRRANGLSIEKVAVASGTSSPTVRLYESNPDDGVKDPRKKDALARTYAELAAKAG